MPFQDAFPRTSVESSDEKLLSREEQSLSEETISLNNPDSMQDEESAITSIRKRSNTARYFRLLWNIVLYVLAIWGAYSLIVGVAPEIQKRLPSKHTSLAESHAFEKVPLARPALDMIPMESQQHHHHQSGNTQEHASHTGHQGHQEHQDGEHKEIQHNHVNEQLEHEHNNQDEHQEEKGSESDGNRNQDVDKHQHEHHEHGQSKTAQDEQHEHDHKKAGYGNVKEE